MKVKTGFKARYMVEKPEDIPVREYDDSAEHPTVEQLFMREAAKHLTKKQAVIWEYWNYDRLTQDEISEKLGISQPAVCQSIRAIEARIQKWVQENQAVYNIIKEQMEKE